MAESPSNSYGNSVPSLGGELGILDEVIIDMTETAVSGVEFVVALGGMALSENRKHPSAEIPKLIEEPIVFDDEWHSNKEPVSSEDDEDDEHDEAVLEVERKIETETAQQVSAALGQVALLRAPVGLPPMTLVSNGHHDAVTLSGAEVAAFGEIAANFDSAGYEGGGEAGGGDGGGE